MTLQEIITEIPTLTIQERKQLLSVIENSFKEEIPVKKHSIMELEGLGAELWEGIDAQEYVNQLRDEWDNRSW